MSFKLSDALNQVPKKYQNDLLHSPATSLKPTSAHAHTQTAFAFNVSFPLLKKKKADYPFRCQTTPGNFHTRPSFAA